MKTRNQTNFTMFAMAVIIICGSITAPLLAKSAQEPGAISFTAEPANNQDLSSEDIARGRKYVQKKKISSSKALDSFLDQLIKKYKITMESGDQLSKSINKKTFLRIKTLSILYSLEQRDLFLGDSEALKGILTIHAYNNIVFFVKPFTQQFYIYPELDVKTFDFVGPLGVSQSVSLMKDKKYVYRLEGDQLTRLNSIDAKTFGLLFNEYTYGLRVTLFKDKRHVYVVGKNNISVINGADPRTFKMVADLPNFFKDKKQVYWYDDAIEMFKHVKADPATVTWVKFGKNGEGYLRDKQFVYYLNPETQTIEPIRDINLAQAKLIFGTIYETESGVYYFNPVTAFPIKVSQLSGGKFKPLTASKKLWSDGEQLYYYNTRTFSVVPLEKIDPASLKILVDSLDAFILRDKDSLFVEQDNSLKQLAGADPSTFTVLGNWFGIMVAKDKNKVYVGKEGLLELAGADSASFEVIAVDGIASYGIDNKQVYYVSRNSSEPHVIVGADPKTFQIKKIFNWYYYGYDSGNVWFYDNTTDQVRKIDGTSPDSFNFEQHAKSYFENYSN